MRLPTSSASIRWIMWKGWNKALKAVYMQAGPSVAAQIKAISIDTTGSTPVAVDETGTPLALLPGFEQNPNAMFVLWKDHTSVKEAAEINAHARILMSTTCNMWAAFILPNGFGPNCCTYCGQTSRYVKPAIPG